MIAIEKLILLTLFVIILLLSLYIVFGTKPTGENLDNQIMLRQCCTTFRAYDCDIEKARNMDCSDSTIGELAARLNLLNGGDDSLLKSFCGCGG